MNSFRNSRLQAVFGNRALSAQGLQTEALAGTLLGSAGCVYQIKSGDLLDACHVNDGPPTRTRRAVVSGFRSAKRTPYAQRTDRQHFWLSFWHKRKGYSRALTSRTDSPANDRVMPSGQIPD